MKKLLIASLLALSSLGAYAERWVPVIDGNSGNRLIVDVDSFTTSVDEGTVYLVAIFRIVTNGEMGTDMVFLTDSGNCRGMSGTLFHRSKASGKWETVQKWWWSKHGTKLYDSAGETLCDILSVRIKEMNTKPSNSKTL